MNVIISDVAWKRLRRLCPGFSGSPDSDLIEWVVSSLCESLEADAEHLESLEKGQINDE